MSPACFPPTVLLLDALLPSTGSPRVEFPRLHGTINALRLPAAPPAALRCLRLAVPREHSHFRSRRRRVLRRRAWSWSPGVPRRDCFRGNDRISHVPGEPKVCLCPALRPRRDRRVRPLRHADAAPALTTTKAPALQLSRLNHTASALAVYASKAGLPRHHARLASGCWPDSSGRAFHPQGSYKGFQTHVMFVILLFQAFVAQGQAVGVLVRTALPRTVGLRKVDLQRSFHLQLLMFGKLLAVVQRQGLPQGRRRGRISLGSDLAIFPTSPMKCGFKSQSMPSYQGMRIAPTGWPTNRNSNSERQSISTASLCVLRKSKVSLGVRCFIKSV